MKDNQEMNDIDPNEGDISIEEIEEDDNQYIDDELIDQDELQHLENNFDIVVEHMEIDENEENQEELDLDIKKEFEGFKADGEIYSMDMNNKGLLVIGDGEEFTYIYDTSKKEIIRKEKFNKDSVVFVRFSADGKYLATGSLDGTVHLFDAENFNKLSTIEGSFSEINVIYY